LLEFKPDKRYQEFWRHFRTGRFSDALATAESLSDESKGRDQSFYQGLARVAESLQHLNQGELQPADRLALTAHVGLKPLGSSYQGVQLQALLMGLNACLEDARCSLDEQGRMQAIRPRIPRVDLALGLDPASTSD
jgi:hypothetical protein